MKKVGGKPSLRFPEALSFFEFFLIPLLFKSKRTPYHIEKATKCEELKKMRRQKVQKKLKKQKKNGEKKRNEN